MGIDIIVQNGRERVVMDRSEYEDLIDSSTSPKQCARSRKVRRH